MFSKPELKEHGKSSNLAHIPVDPSNHCLTHAWSAKRKVPTKVVTPCSFQTNDYSLARRPAPSP